MQGNAEAASWQQRIESVRRFLPARLREREFRLPSGTAVVSAVAAPARPQCVVSIIVPVFNERATFQAMMDALLAKQLPGMRKEIIVVESNSTDGSRELVQSYEGRPGVRILLQPRPRGKGHAVREGLALATGDIVMIQDADLEYDLDDYDGLLAPIAAWQSMFILGSRHQGGWKMRKFNDAPVTAAVFNLGHSFFKSVMNLALNTSMTDPFTMFKVFRRDALFGIDFVCNRFDFDIELVIKLVRKGYVPVELPVNYVSRSFAEGKKVSFVRDGLTWLWTILKLRFSPIGRGPRDANDGRPAVLAGARAVPATVACGQRRLLAAGIALVYRRVNWHDVAAVWTNLDPKFLALAAVAYWLQYPVNSIRLQRVILWATGRLPSNAPPLRFLFKLTCSSGFVAAAAPLGLAGDAAKIAALRLFGSLSITEAARCALFDRVVGVQWICTIGLVTLPFQRAAGIGLDIILPQLVIFAGLIAAVGVLLVLPSALALIGGTLVGKIARVLAGYRSMLAPPLRDPVGYPFAQSGFGWERTLPAAAGGRIEYRHLARRRLHSPAATRQWASVPLHGLGRTRDRDGEHAGCGQQPDHE